MNIVFLTKYFPPDTIGGGEISAYYLACALVKRGHKLTIIKRGKENRGIRSKGFLILEYKDLFSKEVPTLEKKWAQKQAQILIKYIPKGTDIIQAQDFHSSLILAESKALLNFSPPLIATVRDYWPVCGYGKVKLDGRVCPGCTKWSDFKNCPKVVRGNIFQKLVRMFRYYHNIPYRQQALKKIDKVVYISKALKEEINRSKNIRKPLPGYVVYNPIPLDWVWEKEGNRSLGNTILFSGLLDIHKGFSVLLQALRILKNKCGFRLVVAGGGQLFDQYKKMASGLGIRDKINFLGHIPYKLMKDLYNKSDIIVAPSLWPEPFGRTLIEGMLLGKAVIGTNHGAPPEFVKNNENGILVEPGNDKELAEKIILLLENPDLRKRLGQEGRKSVLSNFHPEKIAKQYEIVYQSN